MDFTAASKLSFRFRFIKISLSIIALCMLSGCATFFGVRDEKVTFNSDPIGANVYVSGKFIGQTPVTTRLKTEPEYDVAYLKDGFPVKEFKIRPTDFTHHTMNKSLCFVDASVGVILFNSPLVINMMTGACRSFHDGYFKTLKADPASSSKKTVGSTSSLHGY